MRLVATRRAELGVRLAQDVSAGPPGAIPLLRAGAGLTERYREALLGAGIHAIYVDDEISRGIEPTAPISPATRHEAVRAVDQAFSAAQQALGGGGVLDPDAVGELGRVAELIVADVAASGEVALALADLSAADAYTLQHSIDVAALGVLIGRRLFRERGWLDFRGQRSYARIDERLNRLGLGLLLHDIGKLAIPSDVLNKPGQLSEEEWVVMRAHPLMGLELLASPLISPLTKAVVRSHHERWDGGGYPHGRGGEQIPQLARIASVADVYDAVTSERPYAPARPPKVGFDVVTGGDGTAFDPEVVEVFRDVVAPFPPGHEVLLSDGRRGVVCRVPAQHVDRPVVRVFTDPGGGRAEPEEVALVGASELELVPAA